MKPILFNTEMVRAILDGRKTVTRRVVKGPWYIDDEDVCRTSGYAMHRGTEITHGMPYPDSLHHPGDILYVPEAWKCIGLFVGLRYGVEFRDGQRVKFKFESRERANRWAKYRDKPSRQWQSPYFMPKEAARLFLRVKDVRVERLQDITPEQCVAEGVEQSARDEIGGEFVCGMFNDIWDSTIQKKDLPFYGWSANPWVWVIEFERISREKAMKGANDDV